MPPTIVTSCLVVMVVGKGGLVPPAQCEQPARTCGPRSLGYASAGCHYYMGCVNLLTEELERNLVLERVNKCGLVVGEGEEGGGVSGIAGTDGHCGRWVKGRGEGRGG